MKNALVIVFALILFASAQPAQAQVKLKLGHINTNELMAMMPGRDTAEKALEAYAKNLQTQLEAMQNELNSKLMAYDNEKATLLAPIREAREKELMNMKTNFEDFQSSAQEELASKESELVKPLIDKAKKAIDEVAVEKGYTYIFDTGTGAVIYFSESEDVMPLVKAKLGIQ